MVNGQRNILFQETRVKEVIGDSLPFHTDLSALQLMFYHVEFTVGNILGSNVRKYKVGGFASDQ